MIIVKCIFYNGAWCCYQCYFSITIPHFSFIVCWLKSYTNSLLTSGIWIFISAHLMFKIFESCSKSWVKISPVLLLFYVYWIKTDAQCFNYAFFFLQCDFLRNATKVKFHYKHMHCGFEAADNTFTQISFFLLWVMFIWYYIHLACSFVQNYYCFNHMRSSFEFSTQRCFSM